MNLKHNTDRVSFSRGGVIMDTSLSTGVGGEAGS
jgi:hypothetical protein